MLSRDTRIPKKLFPLLRKNRQCEGEFFSLRVTKLTEELGVSKSVCIISKKTIKKSVDRNRIKRQVYSILYTHLKNSKKSVAIQVFPKKNTLYQKYTYLENDLLTLIHNNNIL
jgi:ribonuclease P protein component